MMVYEALIKGYIEYLGGKNFAQTTVRVYTREAVLILEYMQGLRNIRRLQDIRREDIKSYQDEIYISRRRRDAKPLSMSSKCMKIIALKSLFKYLVKKGEIIYNPASDVEVPKSSRDRVREVLTEREIKKLILCIDGSSDLGVRDRAMIELFYSTGMRNSELRGLLVNDVDLAEGELRIREGKGYLGARERIVPVGRVALVYLEEYLKRARPRLVKGRAEEHLFVNYKGRKMGMDIPNDTVKRYAKKAGIKKNIGAHTLRHTCATHFLRGGGDLRYIQELLGHKSLDSTKLYTKVEISDLKRAHRKYHPRERV